MRLFGRRTESRNKTATDKQLSFCGSVILSRPLSPLQKWGTTRPLPPVSGVRSAPRKFSVYANINFSVSFYISDRTLQHNACFLFYIDTALRCRLAVVPRLICIAFGSLIYTDRTGLENITKKSRAPVPR